MNADIIVPLIATIVYIPLFVILLLNRPWDRKQKYLFLFLVPAILWSFVAFFGRTDFFMWDKSLAVKLVVCTNILVLVQFHYFVRTFYRSERIKIPLAYIFPIATIVLAAAGYIPSNVEVTASGINVDYGPWIIAIGLLFLSIVGVKDIYSLIQKYRLSPNPEERNQIVYLLAAIAILAVFILSSITPREVEFPLSHIGNFIVACILTYAVDPPSAGYQGCIPPSPYIRSPLWRWCWHGGTDFLARSPVHWLRA
jgi:hypothetical protein